MRWKTSLLSAALSGAVLLGGITLMSTTAQARDRACRDISKEERELQRNIRRHGYYSPQANRDRRELRRMRENCWADNRGHWRGDGDHDRDDRRGWRDRDDRWHGRGHDRDHDRNGWRRDRDHDGDRH
jgi:hypothetical protein